MAWRRRIVNAMQQLYNEWRARTLAQDTCAACGVQPVAESQKTCCGERCERNLRLLTGLATMMRAGVMALGVPPDGFVVRGAVGGKRLLEVGDADTNMWDALPGDVVVALLEVSYPLRETKMADFRALAQWRYVSERYRRLVDAMYSQFAQVPDYRWHSTFTDAVLRLFPALRQMHTSVGVATDAALQRLTRLETLEIDDHWHAANNNLAARTNTLGALTTLTTLKLGPMAPPTLSPDALRPLLRLTRLRIRDPDDRVEWDAVLAPLAGLARFTLVRNSGIDALPATWPALRTLKLVQDRVIDDAALAVLTQLTHLDLQDTGERIKDLSPLTALRELCLTDTTVDDISGIASLTALKLAGETELGDEELQGLTQLTRLVLYMNDTVQDALPTLAGLTDLTIKSRNLVRDRDVAPLTGLRRLHIRSGQIGDAGIATLTQLEELDAWNNQHVSDAGLAPLLALRRLDLGFTHDVEGHALLQLTALQELKAGGSHVKAEYLVALQRRGCSVHIDEDQREEVRQYLATQEHANQ